MLENKDFGEYLKNLREQRELSLRKVEMLTNVNYSHLSLIENGLRSVTPALLKTLARVYRVNYLDLYEKAGDKLRNFRLSSSIKLLRLKGYNIITTWETSNNKYGELCRYGRYVLISTPEERMCENGNIKH